MWYKLYIRVGLDGMRLSSGNFAVMYFNSTTYDWIIDDHESGEIFTRYDIVDMRKNTLEYVTANWCDNILRVAADLIMHERLQLMRLRTEMDKNGGDTMERYRIINGQRYEYHHTAAVKGYMSRKVVEEMEEYTGKFGKGYKVHRPRFDTTNYHYVDYYVEVLS